MLQIVPQIHVVRVSVKGSGCSMDSVFMSGIKINVIRQGFDFLQSGVHFVHGSFKQAADAKVEQCIAGKKGFVFSKIILNMSLCVGRNINNLGNDLSECEGFSWFYPDVKAWNASRIVNVGNNFGLVPLFEGQVAVGMVKMMMGI